MKTKDKNGFGLNDIPFLLARINWRDARIAELEAENGRLNDYLTARVNSCHEMQNKMDMAGNVIDDLTAENQILKDKLRAAGYDSADTIEDIQQVERALKKFVKMQGEKINELEAELEKCQKDAFNSGRDVQHRIDGRASAGFAELEY